MCWRFSCDVDTSLRSPGTLVLSTLGCGAADHCSARPAAGLKVKAHLCGRRRRRNRGHLRNSRLSNAGEPRRQRFFLRLGVRPAENCLDRYRRRFFSTISPWRPPVRNHEQSARQSRRIAGYNSCCRVLLRRVHRRLRGFRRAVAIAGAFMIGLGFKPFQAAVLNLIANTAPVAWAHRTPVHALAA